MEPLDPVSMSDIITVDIDHTAYEVHMYVLTLNLIALMSDSAEGRHLRILGTGLFHQDSPDANFRLDSSSIGE
jgi:hypothetical protein